MMGIFALGFAAIQILPGLAYTGLRARTSGPAEVTPSWLLVRALFSRDQSPNHGFL